MQLSVQNDFFVFPPCVSIFFFTSCEQIAFNNEMMLFDKGSDDFIHRHEPENWIVNQISVCRLTGASGCISTSLRNAAVQCL